LSCPDSGTANRACFHTRLPSADFQRITTRPHRRLAGLRVRSASVQAWSDCPRQVSACASRSSPIHRPRVRRQSASRQASGPDEMLFSGLEDEALHA